ncbi:MAG: leucine--tRNA ligase [Oligoflexia bacterium]|nr:leucine--tRNA ligase [Oligoflexia bacterium]
MPYNYQKIEDYWQRYWSENKLFRTETPSQKPKYYILDMFPYPSGAGLHVGHPLGYIATDILSRYKRHQGFNVLHPMGWDAFGLPAEQYAIETGQHPAVTTEKNIKTYKKQLDRLGFSFDWEREVNTSEPSYYKWTQWAFIEMFHHYYDEDKDKALPIKNLTEHFSKNGSSGIQANHNEHDAFTKEEWQFFSEQKKEEILQCYRIAYQADLPVNWCAKLGTVLANDEVSNGLSVRGGHPVEQKIMKQWSLRISAYAERLLQGLEKIEWSESIKEMQRNWIGKSKGAEVDFLLETNEKLRIFTTRPDTIFGVTFMVLAPESEWVIKLTTSEQKAEVEKYIKWTKSRTERERQAEAKNVTGIFTGSYAIHPFTKKKIPIWIADYVLGGYGTGAIMAVPAHDSRDHAFAKTFKLPIVPVVSGEHDYESTALETHEGSAINSEFLNNLSTKEAIEKACERIENDKLGVRTTNYRLRDAIFSRQRFWGEPFPVYYKNEIPHTLSLSELPLVLPEVDKYLPTEEGEPPLARAKSWKTKEGYLYEYSTMPGFAGSSAYYLRYMDPKNASAIASKENIDYWGAVDLYLGGSEHATGHLIYARFWCMFLHDIGLVPFTEPFKKLINQGMIQGRSNLIYRMKKNPKTYVSKSYVSKGEVKEEDVQKIHVDVNLVQNDFLDVAAYKKSKPDLKDADFQTESHDGKEAFLCDWAVEKMSKSLFNVVNPDAVCEQYGADTLRLFEMFLGPLEQSKPWNTSGIDGVHRFLHKLWRWLHDDTDADKISTTENSAKPEDWKLLHQTIQKITQDMDSLNFNTCVSQFMICVNQFSASKVKEKSFIETFLILLSPFAPHMAEELWHRLGHTTSVTKQSWPKVDKKWLVESEMKIVVQVNGKLRAQFMCDINATEAEIFEKALALPEVIKQLENKELKKKIYVPKKLVNLVVV